MRQIPQWVHDGSGVVAQIPRPDGGGDMRVGQLDPFSVLLFGAVGDGITDDTAAIQAALDAAEAAGGGTVALPAGRYRITSGLSIGAAHLVGPGGASFSRTTPSIMYGAVIAPDIDTPDAAALTIRRSSRGTHVRGIAFDLRNMADGTADDPFTRSQTKGIHVDGAWNTTLENVYLTHTPSNAAAIYVDAGTPALGSFWGRMVNVFVDQYTKRGIANGYTGPEHAEAVPEAAKDQTARGVCMNGGTSAGGGLVTAQSLIDTTTYRGLYCRGVQNLTGQNFSSERAPGHGAHIEASTRLSFQGGFVEYAGNEAADGDDGIYRTFHGVDAPTVVRILGVTLVGDKPAGMGDGFVLDAGDPNGLSSGGGPRYKEFGSLRIDRANIGQFTKATDVRLLGPYSATTISADTDTVLWFSETGDQVHDPSGLYNPESAVFTFAADSVTGVNHKVQVGYAIHLRGGGPWGADDYVDIKVALAGAKFPSGVVVPELRHRHYLIPGNSKAFVTGSFEFTVANNSGANSFFQVKARTNRTDVSPGLSSAESDRGFLTYRAVA